MEPMSVSSLQSSLAEKLKEIVDLKLELNQSEAERRQLEAEVVQLK